MDVEPFEIAVGDDVLADLQERLRRTRWPSAAPGAPWAQGADLAYLQDLCAYWADGSTGASASGSSTRSSTSSPTSTACACTSSTCAAAARR